MAVLGDASLRFPLHFFNATTGSGHLCPSGLPGSCKLRKHIKAVMSYFWRHLLEYKKPAQNNMSLYTTGTGSIENNEC